MRTYSYRTARFFRVFDFSEYDAAYQVWKGYKKKRIDRGRAMMEIDDRYGVRPFFLLYPLYKIIKPFIRAKRTLVRKLGRGE